MPTKAKENVTKRSTKKETKVATKLVATKGEVKPVKKTSTKEAETTAKAKKAVKEKAVKSTTKKTASKKVTTKKAAKNESTKKNAPALKTTEKKSTAKKSTAVKKSSSKKVGSTKSTKKAKETTVVKKRAVKKSSAKKTPISSTVEYYDLPNSYNQTMVKILFQTPKKLFVYWEISEIDRENLIGQNGKDFFENSTPFLIVKNDTMHYSFEVQINDYANSWYFDIPDSNCEYSVELIRKYRDQYIPIRSSNELEVPNNHILFEKNRREIFFINVKNNNITSKNIANLHFIKHLGIARPITINDFYNKFYNEEDLYGQSNPSSY